MRIGVVEHFAHCCVGAGDVEDAVDLVHRISLSRGLHCVIGIGELLGVERVGISGRSCHRIGSCYGDDGC
jgi:pentatricopeptide repeat protein